MEVDRSVFRPDAGAGRGGTEILVQKLGERIFSVNNAKNAMDPEPSGLP